MPWCESCATYHETPGDGVDGVCPSCGAVLTETSGSERTVGQSAPWHFWIVVVALAGYLLWRLIEGVIWLVS